MSRPVDVGDVVPLRCSWRLRPTPAQEALGLQGSLANPSTVLLKLRSPAGVTTTIAQAAMTNPSVGVWEYELLVGPTAEGLQRVRWEGTGAVTAAAETEFVVRSTEFYP